MYCGTIPGLSFENPSQILETTLVIRTDPSTLPILCETFGKLDEEFSITHRFFIPSHVKDAYLKPARNYILINGNLHLKHDLNFDWGHSKRRSKRIRMKLTD